MARAARLDEGEGEGEGEGWSTVTAILDGLLDTVPSFTELELEAQARRPGGRRRTSAVSAVESERVTVGPCGLPASRRRSASRRRGRCWRCRRGARRVPSLCGLVRSRHGRAAHGCRRPPPLRRPRSRQRPTLDRGGAHRGDRQRHRGDGARRELEREPGSPSLGRAPTGTLLPSLNSQHRARCDLVGVDGAVVEDDAARP